MLSMTKEDIIALPNELLHKKSKKVNPADPAVKELIESMTKATVDWENSREHEIAVALAAVQVAKLHRVIIVRSQFKNKKDASFTAYLNPEIVKGEGEPVEAMEGCLSVPDLYGQVPRYPKIKFRAVSLEGKPVRLTATGFLARVLQHEIDHTNGQVFVDHVKDPTKLFQLEADGNFIPLKS